MTATQRPGSGAPQFTPSPLASRYALPAEGAFGSRAKTMAGFNQDVTDFLTATRRASDTAPPSAGITTPTPKGDVRTFQDVLNITAGYRNDMRSRQGGRGLDSSSTMVDQNYAARRYEFMVESEGVRHRAYDDKTGEPVTPGTPVQGLSTVGIGFNMDRPEAAGIYRAATGKDNFEAVRSGRARITEEDSRRLFTATIQDAEQLVQGRFKDQQLNEYQRLALVSLAFNNPSLIGPNLTAAVKGGNLNAARDEILYRSNGGETRSRGIAARRYREAMMFVGTTNAPDALPPYSEYISKNG